MKRSYLDYAMSVIVSRALPDARDGLKPVHRRILYSMYENGYDWSKPYRKSARVVGDVIGKYHPHGDQAVYDALVRMAQAFSMRVPLIDGQGNFGSVDGDPPAAMRYTEVRMARPAGALVEDLDKQTVDFQPNYDGQDREPTVLPARYPNLLVNGAGGIAVGMATNIPPHNLGETIDAAIRLIEAPETEIDELMELMQGPDFPTGGYILGRAGIRAAFHTGRGSVTIRAKTSIEQVGKDREAIIVHEIPYQVNKASLVEKIAELVREKRVEGISDLRDESDRLGIRVVVELKRDTNAEIVLNQLFRYSQLQTTFGVNALALNAGRPEQLDLKQLLMAFLTFREEVIARRTKFLLNKARDRAHVLVGLAVAVANVDEVIRLIRAAPDPATAREQLMARAWPAGEMIPFIRLIDDPRHKLEDDGTFRLSEEQARAILDLRLQRLTALGRDEIGNELTELGEKIADYLDILRSRVRVMEIIRAELMEIRDAFATPRKTEILDIEGELDDESLIAPEDMVVTVTHGGYIKRVPADTYRAQKRGGRGRSGMATREEDFVTRIFVANTLTPVLFFSTAGMAYMLKVWRLPVGTPQSRGKAMVNLLPLSEGESIATVLPVDRPEEDWGGLHVVFVTSRGNIRRNELSDFVNVRSNGKIAMKLDEGERLISVRICTENDDCLLTTRLGRTIRFPVTDVRVFKGRESTGVRGIRLAKGDEVIGLTVLSHVEMEVAERDAYFRQASATLRDGAEAVEEAMDEDESAGGEAVSLSMERYTELSALEQFVLVLSTKGYGKRVSAHRIRTIGRGGQGVQLFPASAEEGKGRGTVAAAFRVEPTDEIVLVSNAGQLIRTRVSDISIQGRGAAGVTVFRTGPDEQVVSVARLAESSGDDEDGEDGEDGGIGGSGGEGGAPIPGDADGTAPGATDEPREGGD
ncbi:MAG: DNA gyrase subunit A [Alphaproteobacteria bacterium]|nr:DNA gyrase subunit A [Alphaproteobacteria bacterium]MDX5367794.1 DNA gyrase subunit A [Alphaproteobacteria bacterium]MDX5462680.1 DNA gyrase subunit A [Alphaproteobacteria bacterium]